MTTTQVKERPILFSGPMVRAILSGQKTQTRRIITPQPPEGQAIDRCHYSSTGWACCDDTGTRGCHCRDERRCPYGLPGDRLWVRETWSASWDGRPICNLKPSEYDSLSRVWYRAENNRPTYCETKWTPSIYMPRWASRITLEVTDVRVERLQDISEADAEAEGLARVIDESNSPVPPCTFTEAFADIWDKLNSQRGYAWGSNPWVWVVEFMRV